MAEKKIEEKQNKFDIIANGAKRRINNEYRNLSDMTEIQLDLKDIIPFKDHPFKVLDNKDMEDLMDSIKEQGIITPIIVRKIENNKYEIISGHRRVHAAKRLELKTVPCIVKELDDDQATIFMVDSNKQREEVLPSERAWSLRMKSEAMSRRHKYNKEIGDQNGPEKRTSKLLAEEFEIGQTQVKRFIRLTYLMKELLDMVDDKKLGFAIAVEISYLSSEQQEWIWEYIGNNGSITPDQISAVRVSVQKKEEFSYDDFIEAMESIKPKQKKESTKITFTQKKLDKYFPSDMSTKQREDLIIELLERWKNEQ